MRAFEWPHIVRALRDLHGLTPAQFALMVDVTPEMVNNWEAGQALPEHPQQAILRDLLSGHFRHHPTFLGLKAMVRGMGEIGTLYMPGMVAHTISSPLERWLAPHRLNILGQSILPELDGLTGEMIERYALPMLAGKSDVLALAYTDLSVADRRTVMRRTLSVVPIDGVQAMVLTDRILYRSDGHAAPDLDLQIVTAEDVRE